MSWYETLKTEVGNVTWFITVPQLITTPLSVWIIDRIRPDFFEKELLEVLDFLVISFPMTVAIAIIAYLVKSGEADAMKCIMAILGAAFVSNLLHKFVHVNFPEVPLYRAYYDVWPSVYDTEYVFRSQGIVPWVKLAIKMLMIYLQQFGIVICIQALSVGIYGGLRLYAKNH